MNTELIRVLRFHTTVVIRVELGKLPITHFTRSHPKRLVDIDAGQRSFVVSAAGATHHKFTCRYQRHPHRDVVAQIDLECRFLASGLLPSLRLGRIERPAWTRNDWR